MRLWPGQLFLARRSIGLLFRILFWLLLLFLLLFFLIRLLRISRHLARGRCLQLLEFRYGVRSSAGLGCRPFLQRHDWTQNDRGILQLESQHGLLILPIFAFSSVKISHWRFPYPSSAPLKPLYLRHLSTLLTATNLYCKFLHSTVLVVALIAEQLSPWQ
jgi:hypothetical protein